MDLLNFQIEINLEETEKELEKIRKLIKEIEETKEHFISCFGDEKQEKALLNAIKFKSGSNFNYATYEKGGDKILCLINTEDNSTIHFKVESIIGGIEHEKFHPEKMFPQIK